MKTIYHSMSQRKVFNAEKSNSPEFHAVLYGNKVATTKFSKRLACGTKHLPLRLDLTFEHDAHKAVEKGVKKDPTLELSGEIFIEGLPQTEAITEAFKQKLEMKE